MANLTERITGTLKNLFTGWIMTTPEQEHQIANPTKQWDSKTVPVNPNTPKLATRLSGTLSSFSQQGEGVYMIDMRFTDGIHNGELMVDSSTGQEAVVNIKVDTSAYAPQENEAIQAILSSWAADGTALWLLLPVADSNYTLLEDIEGQNSGRFIYFPANP